jgi:AcrR family transcriptional regulator
LCPCNHPAAWVNPSYGRVPMSPRPLTRQESQARTRARLVQSAEKVFLKRGYIAASIGQIARQAGYTTGAVYSNFDSKEDLGLAVLERRMLDVATGLEKELAAAEPTIEARLAVLESFGSGVMGSERWVVLGTEFLLASRNKPAIRKRFADEMRSTRTTVAGILRTQQDELGGELPLDADELAAAILGLGFGLSIQRIADPEVSADTFAAVVGLLLGRSPAPAAAPAKVR